MTENRLFVFHQSCLLLNLEHWPINRLTLAGCPRSNTAVLGGVGFGGREKLGVGERVAVARPRGGFVDRSPCTILPVDAFLFQNLLIFWSCDTYTPQQVHDGHLFKSRRSCKGRPRLGVLLDADTSYLLHYR